MNKSQFLSLYIYPPNEAKIRIRMLFNTDAFMRNNTIKVTTGKVSLQDALSYYVPKYKKNGKRDTRSIEQQIEDPDVS